ncbi:CYTH domain-containing protein [Heyndrickxia sp. MSNUG]|uniref:CYTH domain-containing protein n=1 Tax=Heyndrickxia sp. MSNUG TaxID=3136677 RepID=UPI003C2F775A
MSQNIEIEFKNMLTNDEFLRLIKHFNIDLTKFKKQVNHYFDTPSFSLKAKGSALRIREKGTQFEMTLKQPAEQGLLETNQFLNPGQAEYILKTGKILEGEVQDAITNMIDDADTLEYFGSLTTDRAEFDYKGGLLVLDHSYYLNTEDYELEYEVTDESEGFKIFSGLLDELNIPVRTTDNKIKRFYNRKREGL